MSKYTLIRTYTNEDSVETELIETGLDFPKYYFFNSHNEAKDFLLGSSFEGEICEETASRTFRENGTIITKSVIKLH